MAPDTGPKMMMGAMNRREPTDSRRTHAPASLFFHLQGGRGAGATAKRVAPHSCMFPTSVHVGACSGGRAAARLQA